MTSRNMQPEVMDDPALDAARHRRALQGLARINRFSGSARIVWPSIEALARLRAPQPIRILDVATGAGDVPLALWQRARAAGWSMRIDGCDCSPVAVTYAREHAARAGADITFFGLDVFTEPLPSGYDVLTASLFLHHLEEEQAIALLHRMAQAAGSLVLVNDLVRSLSGFLLAFVGTRLLSGSDVVHTDGPRSVEAAFTLDEVRRMAVRAGLDRATIAPRWPCRFLLTWSRS